MALRPIGSLQRTRVGGKPGSMRAVLAAHRGCPGSDAFCRTGPVSGGARGKLVLRRSDGHWWRQAGLQPCRRRRVV